MGILKKFLYGFIPICILVSSAALAVSDLKSEFSGTNKNELIREKELNIEPLPDGVYDLPAYYPREDHPRVLITKEDIPRIKENMKKEESKNAVAQLYDYAQKEYDGFLPQNGTTNFDKDLCIAIEARAFLYLINGDEKMGRDAIRLTLNMLDTATFGTTNDVTRERGQTIFIASKVYDWCYPLLSGINKKEIVAYCENIAKGMETFWPPTGCGAVTGHGGEAQFLRDQLTFAIATYNEFPDIYNFIAGRFFQEFVPARNYYYPSHSYHQGSGYNSCRFTFDLWAQWLLFKSTGQTVFADDCRYVAYQYIYYTRPDGQIFREGDYTTELLGAIPQTNYYSLRIAYLAASFYNDPYLKAETERLSLNYSRFFSTFPSFTAIDFLLLNNPDLKPEPTSELPKTKYFGSPNGLMVARTDWNDGVKAPTAIAFMKIGEMWMGNHQHLDAGSFQIYYKGNLANDAGIYDGYGTAVDYNWSKETISHNALLIYDPDEVPYQSVNSGGQRRPGTEHLTLDSLLSAGYDSGKVVGHEFGPSKYTPEYSYISGDITRAYTEKVSEVKRSMMFMPTNNEKAPAVFFVMDKINSANPSFKKTFLLHSLQEPEAEGNVTVIKRDTDGYNGKLTNQTLYPKNVNIEKIGGPGKQWSIDGINYPPSKNTDPNTINENMAYGWGRIEISPTEKRNLDYFLNVMYVSDADDNQELNEAELIETNDFLGAKILNKVSLFAKNSDEFSGDIAFTVPAGENDLDIAVTGIAKGKWDILYNGNYMGSEISSEDGKMIFFKGKSGVYTLKLSDKNAVKEEAEEGKPSPLINLYLNNEAVYASPGPVIENNRVMIPLRTLFEKINADVQYDSETKSAVIKIGNKELKFSNNSDHAIINGESEPLDAPAHILNNKFYIPLRFFSENYSGVVRWSEALNSVFINLPYQSPNPKYIPIISSRWSSETGDDKKGYNAYDGDTSTRWAALGDGEWLLLEFKDINTVSSFAVNFFNPLIQQYSFDLYASEDGNNFTKFYSAASSAKEGYEEFALAAPVKARYIKYVGHGNQATLYNLLQEIEFYKE